MHLRLPRVSHTGGDTCVQMVQRKEDANAKHFVLVLYVAVDSTVVCVCPIVFTDAQQSSRAMKEK